MFSFPLKGLDFFFAGRRNRKAGKVKCFFFVFPAQCVVGKWKFNWLGQFLAIPLDLYLCFFAPDRGTHLVSAVLAALPRLDVDLAVAPALANEGPLLGVLEESGIDRFLCDSNFLCQTCDVLLMIHCTYTKQEAPNLLLLFTALVPN